jgi:hypothetical protein
MNFVVKLLRLLAFICQWAVAKRKMDHGYEITAGALWKPNITVSYKGTLLALLYFYCRLACGIVLSRVLVTIDGVRIGE